MFKRVATIVVTIAIVATALLISSHLTAKKAQAGYWGMPVILVHGFNLQNNLGCNDGNTFGGIKSFFINNGWGNSLHSVGWYNQDHNCDGYLYYESYHCTGWYSSSNDGTVNEDIRHVSCLLAWYIWDYYTHYFTKVAVIAHSMGGILIRQALNDTPYVAAFPPYLMVTDAVTAGTPHQGLTAGAAWGLGVSQGCPGNCTQITQMEAYNALMSNMNSTSWRNGFARNPQGYGGTDWTTMSGNADEMLWWGAGVETLGSPYPVSALELCGLMPGAKHFVVYPGPSPSYNHGGYLIDPSTSWNANEIFSDNNGGNWVTTSTSAHSILTMYFAVQFSDW
jgi:hypothetical protein